jgi:hypothetical protein
MRSRLCASSHSFMLQTRRTLGAQGLRRGRNQETLGRERSPVSYCSVPPTLLLALARGDECWVSLQCTGQESTF